MSPVLSLKRRIPAMRGILLECWRRIPGGGESSGLVQIGGGGGEPPHTKTQNAACLYARHEGLLGGIRERAMATTAARREAQAP